MTLYFTGEHEWIRVEGDVGTVGITDHAQQQLGDVVFVELPEAGRSVQKGGEAAVVESVKAASEVYAPLTGAIIESNGELAENPGLVNEDPEGRAWFFKVRIEDTAELQELMDREAYDAYLATIA